MYSNPRPICYSARHMERQRQPRKGTVQELLADMGDHLEFLREEGLRTVASDPVTAQALRKPLPAAGTPPPAANVPQHPPVSPSAPVPVVIVPHSAPVAVPSGDPATALQTLAAQISSCKACVLHATRTKTVPGQGNPTPEILFVGEGPGEDEDKQGLAFVGRAGQLLAKMIEAMGYTRDQVFIANIVKCHPPGTETTNRAPSPEEMAACLPYLKAQIKVLKPKVIVALGGVAVRGLLNTETGIMRLRGTWQTFEGIPVMPTYHPSYLLRNAAGKPAVWKDLQEVLARLGRKPPPQNVKSRVG